MPHQVDDLNTRRKEASTAPIAAVENPREHENVDAGKDQLQHLGDEQRPQFVVVLDKLSCIYLL